MRKYTLPCGLDVAFIVKYIINLDSEIAVNLGLVFKWWRLDFLWISIHYITHYISYTNVIYNVLYTELTKLSHTLFLIYLTLPNWIPKILLKGSKFNYTCHFSHNLFMILDFKMFHKQEKNMNKILAEDHL